MNLVFQVFYKIIKSLSFFDFKTSQLAFETIIIISFFFILNINACFEISKEFIL